MQYQHFHCAVRQAATTCLRHRNNCALSRNPESAMNAYADTASHSNACKRSKNAVLVLHMEEITIDQSNHGF